jgi:hypothetical protein
MEPYLLTQEDIDKLVALNKDMNGVAPGTEAYPAELEVLGIQPAAVDPAPVTAPAATPVTAPAATPVTAPANDNMALLQQMLDAQKPAQPFSYESMSKDQRRMLAFAGLSDAGRALQGLQGGKVEALLGRFNEQADIQRKATAAAAQRQMLQGLIGTSGAGQDPQARIQQLINMGIVNPQLTPAIALQIKQIQDQMQATEGAVSSSSQAATQLEDVNALINMIDEDPTLTTGIMGSLLSYFPGTGANIAEGLATTLRSNLALQALKDLKATGATMGALNEKEFNALETELTQLDLSKGPQTSKRALKRIQTKYQNLIADAYRDAEEQAASGNPNGQRALDGLNRIFGGGKPAWTENAGPVVPSGTQREGETLEEFKKRMGLK